MTIPVRLPFPSTLSLPPLLSSLYRPRQFHLSSLRYRSVLDTNSASISSWSRRFHRSRIHSISPNRYRRSTPHYDPFHLPGFGIDFQPLRQSHRSLRWTPSLLWADGRGCRVLPKHGIRVSQRFLFTWSAQSLMIYHPRRPQNRQTSADFLVAVTDPAGRFLRDGVDARSVPRTAEEFADYFTRSKLGQANLAAVKTLSHHPEHLDTFRASAKKEFTKGADKRASYLISYPMQIRLAMTRRLQMQMGELPTLAIVTIAAIFQALIIGSYVNHLYSCVVLVLTRCSQGLLPTRSGHVSILFSRRSHFLRYSLQFVHWSRRNHHLLRRPSRHRSTSSIRHDSSLCRYPSPQHRRQSLQIRQHLLLRSHHLLHGGVATKCEPVLHLCALHLRHEFEYARAVPSSRFC